MHPFSRLRPLVTIIETQSVLTTEGMDRIGAWAWALGRAAVIKEERTMWRERMTPMLTVPRGHKVCKIIVVVVVCYYHLGF